MLRYKSIHWEVEHVELVSKDLSSMSSEEKDALIELLDRRLYSLWEKVRFEREWGLVDYAPVRKYLGI